MAPNNQPESQIPAPILGPQKTLPGVDVTTWVETCTGPKRAGDLMVGDRIFTPNNGAQPLLWVGRFERLSWGYDAPLEVEAEALGVHGVVSVSRDQPIMLTSNLAKSMFGEAEVLIRAQHLVGTLARFREDGNSAEFILLLCGQQQVFCANNLPVATFKPCRHSLALLDDQQQEDILDVLPNRDGLTGFGYGPTARVVMRDQESRAILKDVFFKEKRPRDARALSRLVG